jgi:hypothetical protein
VIRGVGFIFAELFRTSLRSWTRWLGFSLALGLVLASGSALALLQEGRSEGGFPQTYWILVLKLSPDLRDEKINELGWHFWTLEGVKRVSYRFAGDELPGGGTAEERSLLLWTEEGSKVEGLVKQVQAIGEGAITEVDVIHRVMPPPASLPPLSRVVAMVALALFAFISLVVGRVAVGGTFVTWQTEWDFLRYSGVEPWKLWGPFVGTAALWGLFGGAIYLLVYEGIKFAVRNIVTVTQIAPGYLSGGPLPFVVAFVVAPLWGATAGGIALFLSLHRKPYPRGLEEV